MNECSAYVILSVCSIDMVDKYMILLSSHENSVQTEVLSVIPVTNSLWLLSVFNNYFFLIHQSVVSTCINEWMKNLKYSQ